MTTVEVESADIRTEGLGRRTTRLSLGGLMAAGAIYFLGAGIYDTVENGPTEVNLIGTPQVVVGFGAASAYGFNERFRKGVKSIGRNIIETYRNHNAIIEPPIEKTLAEPIELAEEEVLPTEGAWSLTI